MPTLSIFVTGVCGFMEDFKRVVLVNATQPSLFTVNSDRQVVVPPHYAFLRFATDQVDVVAGAKSLKHAWDVLATPIPMMHTGTISTEVLFLDHHRVVPPAAQNTTFNPNKDLIEEIGIPQTTGDESLEWVLRMSQLLPGSQVPNPDYLTDKPGESIAAFATFAVGDVVNAYAPLYQFLGTNAISMGIVGRLNRSLSQMVRYDLQVADPIVIQCPLFAEGPKRAPFYVSFKTGLTNPWMILGLSALDDILQLTTVDSGEGSPDFHSRLLYRMSKTLYGDFDVILPQGEPQPPTAEIGVPRCVPALFGG